MKKRRRRKTENKKKKKEEERRKKRRKKKSRYRIGLWNRSMDYMYRICVWKICVWNFGIELFGLIVVLNGGKNCIEKMLGFRGDVVKNFLKPTFLSWS